MHTSLATTGQRPRVLSTIGMLVVLAVVTAPWTPTQAIDNKTTRTTLQGLAGVEIGIAPVSPELEQAGVTVQSLQTEVAQQLRRADIAVFTSEEAQGRPNVAFFTVSVSTLNHDLGVYAYSVDLALYQSATLMRDSTPLSLPTWSMGSLGMLGESRLPSIVNTVRTNVDQFIKAYRTVNPRAARATDPTDARIRRVQERLRRAGQSPGPADGRLGPQTRQALRRYQRAKGLRVTGEADAKTLRALGIK